MDKETPLIFGSEVVKLHLTKVSYKIVNTLLAQFDEFDEWCFFTKFLNLLTKSIFFNILHNVFIVYC